MRALDSSDVSPGLDVVLGICSWQRPGMEGSWLGGRHDRLIFLDESGILCIAC